jgi:hypothetical protein
MPGEYLVDEFGNTINTLNPLPTSLTGRNVKDVFSGSANVTKTYPTSMRGFSLVNDGAPDVTFTIGGKTITVKQNETFDASFDPFTSVTVTATGAFRAIVKG